ncbi:MAG: Ig-like domain-containing protein [Chitinophagales bacterium]|nr:Ig-like domain-containing protein [Chitinophagales bacterium]
MKSNLLLLIMLFFGLSISAFAQENCSSEQCVEAFEGINNHSIYLADLPGTARYVFYNNSGVFESFADGTAHLTGTIVNKDDPDKMWVIDIYFKNRMDYATWEAMSNPPHYKGNSYDVGLHYLNWDYYTIDSGDDGQKSTIKGVDGSDFEDWILYLSQDTDGGKYTTQVGQAANDQNTAYGISTWFHFSGYDNMGTEIKPKRGDVNVDFCESCTGTYSYTVNAAAGTFTYTVSPYAEGTVSGSTISLFNLCHGNYTITITYQDGSEEEVSFEIDTPSYGNFTYQVSNVSNSDSDACNGSAQINVMLMGGATNFTYDLNSTGNVSANGNMLTLSGLCCGNNSIDIMYDGCQQNVSFYVGCNQVNNCNANSSVTTVGAIVGSTNGSASVVLSGVGSDYTYDFNDEMATVISNGNNISVSGLACGSYTLTVTYGDDDCEMTILIVIPCLNACGLTYDLSTSGAAEGETASTATINLNVPDNGAYTYVYEGPGALYQEGENIYISQLPCGEYSITIIYEDEACSLTIPFMVECIEENCNALTDFCTEIGNSIVICPVDIFCDLKGTPSYDDWSYNLPAFFQVSGDCIVYTPMVTVPDNDVLTITASDDYGFTETVVLNIQIGDCEGSNNGCAVDDFVQTPINISVGVNVLGNDNVNIATSYVTNVTQPDYGSVSLSINSKQIIYSPPSGYTGFAHFTYDVLTPNGICGTANVTIQILSQAQLCQLPTDICVDPGTSLEICPVSCDVPNATAQQVISSLGGSYTILSGGCVHYTVPEFVTGVDTVEVISCNAQNECGSVFVYLTVGNCDETMAQAKDNVYSVNRNNSLDLNIYDNDIITEDTYLVSYTLPKNGMLMYMENGGLRYTPNADFIGFDDFIIPLLHLTQVCNAQK